MWNRSSAKAHQLSGVRVAESLEEVAKNANVIFSCLLNDKAVQACYDDVSDEVPYAKMLISVLGVNP